MRHGAKNKRSKFWLYSQVVSVLQDLTQLIRIRCIMFAQSRQDIMNTVVWGLSNVKKKKLRGLNPLANYSDRRLSAKLLPTFADRGWHVVSVTDPFSRILDFIDRMEAVTLLKCSYVNIVSNSSSEVLSASVLVKYFA
jgi:hypothetical protein